MTVKKINEILKDRYYNEGADSLYYVTTERIDARFSSKAKYFIFCKIYKGFTCSDTHLGKLMDSCKNLKEVQEYLKIK